MRSRDRRNLKKSHVIRDGLSLITRKEILTMEKMKKNRNKELKQILNEDEIFSSEEYIYLKEATHFLDLSLSDSKVNENGCYTILVSPETVKSDCENDSEEDYRLMINAFRLLADCTIETIMNGETVSIPIIEMHERDKATNEYIITVDEKVLQKWGQSPSPSYIAVDIESIKKLRTNKDLKEYFTEQIRRQSNNTLNVLMENK